MSKIILTDEQKDIINSIYDDEKIIKINAYAGCAKTTTLVELVKEIRKKDSKSKILYLVFNKSMVLDSKIKFDALDLNVDTNTIHSFALKRFRMIKDENIDVIPSLDFSIFMKIKNSDKYKKSWINYKDILELLNTYCLTYDDMPTFCNNIVKNYTIYGLKNGCKPIIATFFNEIYNKMVESKKYTHGMYLKEYSCNCADSPKYDYVLLDECQDTSRMALNIIKRIKYKKLYAVGDSYQNIYSFMKTINVFKIFDGVSYPLSTSFRFNNKICEVANDILNTGYDDFKFGSIKNNHNIPEPPSKFSKTILFRLNSELFEYAVTLISETENARVKFMDIINGNRCEDFDTIFADLIYFYYSLIKCKDEQMAIEFSKNFNVVNNSKIVDQYIKIANKTDRDFYSYLCFNKIILPLDLQKYFNFFLLNEKNIIDVLNKVRMAQDMPNASREFILCTAHSSKGLEYDWVKIAPGRWSMQSKDEVNLIYVACTRARYALDYEAIKPLLEEKRIYAR